MSPVRAEVSGRDGGAPALEKGLDLLEALAAEPGGITQKDLAALVGKSVNEIFRMLGVLERRGYIARDAKTGAYSLTLRLFQLALHHPPTRRLQHVALPIMEMLAAETGLSCHLSMPTQDGQFLIVAEAEPPLPMGWVVKLGAVFPFTMQYASARVLAAFQNGPRRQEMALHLAANSKQPKTKVLSRLDTIAASGHDMAASELAIGLTDLSCPVLDEHGHAVAALTLPFLPRLRAKAKAIDMLPALRAAAAEMSARIGGASGQHFR
ncbi:IclR family transcriptional regulator [Acidocella sp.]|jgi:DNA-binding IclR family transcriptional regulator|uniref:IclR family transcriptional regulator n=1 Tax=Acidocella sp. TaxID=50710 RepID=UPI002F41FA7C